MAHLVKIGKEAPDFKAEAVVDGSMVFEEMTLHKAGGLGTGDVDAPGWICLFFYPLDFTFVCPTEIIAFNDAAERFKKLNCGLVACSVDSCFSHYQWVQLPRAEGGLGPETKIPLMSDMTKSISKSYGVLDDDAGIALRGLFLIDPKRIVRHMYVNDSSVGRNPQETLRLLQAFQHFDEVGEVCGANWSPGQKAIKPTIDGVKEFFHDSFGSNDSRKRKRASQAK